MKTVSEAMEYGNKVIDELRAMTKDLSDLCNNWDKRDKDEYIDRFIEDNQELIYEKYCDINAEEVHSNFLLEDIDIEYLVDFINDYLEEELLAYIDKYKYGKE